MLPGVRSHSARPTPGWPAGSRWTAPGDRHSTRRGGRAGARPPRRVLSGAAPWLVDATGLEQTVVARGRRRPPTRAAAAVERLRPRVHLVVGHRPLRRRVLRQVAPPTPGEEPHAVAGIGGLETVFVLERVPGVAAAVAVLTLRRVGELRGAAYRRTRSRLGDLLSRLQ